MATVAKPIDRSQAYGYRWKGLELSFQIVPNFSEKKLCWHGVLDEKTIIGHLTKYILALFSETAPTIFFKIPSILALN